MSSPALRARSATGRLVLSIGLACGLAWTSASTARAQSNDEDLLGGFDKPTTQPAPAPKPAPKPAPAPAPAAKPAEQPLTEYPDDGPKGGAKKPAAADTAAKPADAPAPVPAAAPVVEEKTVAPSNELDDAPASAASMDRIKAVPRKPLLKKGRFELTPMAGLSLNDAYYQHYTLGGTAIYYPHDAFGIGVGVDYLYQHTRRDAIDDVRNALTSVPAVYELPKLFAHVDMYWIPLYGKFSLFNSVIIPFDIYASAGGGAATAFSNSRWFPEVNAAIGARMAMTEWLALRIEVRDHIFLDTQEVNTVPRSDIQNYAIAQIGLSFFIPPTFEYSF